MQDFVSFWSAMFGVVCDFLLSPPIIWFVGIFILICVCAFLQRLINIK